MRRGRPPQEGGALVQLVLVLLVLGLVVVELAALAVTTFQVDGRARQVAVAAAHAYEPDQSVAAARAAGAEEADAREVEMTSLEVTGDQVLVTVRARAPTLLTHRIGPLRDRTLVTGQGRARWR